MNTILGFCGCCAEAEGVVAGDAAKHNPTQEAPSSWRAKLLQFMLISLCWASMVCELGMLAVMATTYASADSRTAVPQIRNQRQVRPLGTMHAIYQGVLRAERMT